MKNKDIHIRITESEFNLLKNEAEAQFMTVSQIIRKLINCHIKK